MPHTGTFSNSSLKLFNSAARLIETADEKLFRMEKKWLAGRIQELEASKDPNDPDRSKPYIEKLASVIDDFRRLKFMIEQETAIRAGKALFETQENLLKFTNETACLYYEEMESYLKKKIDEKFSSKRDLIDKARIMKMIQPREWDERTLKPYSYSEEFKRLLTKEDSVEAMRERERRLVIELWRMEEEKQFFFEERQEQEDTDGESKDDKLGELDEDEVLEDDDKWKNRMELAKGKEGVGLKEKDLTELETDRDERLKMRQSEINKMKEEEEGAVKLMEERRQVFDADEEREKLLKFIEDERMKGKGGRKKALEKKKKESK